MSQSKFCGAVGSNQIGFFGEHRGEAQKTGNDRWETPARSPVGPEHLHAAFPNGATGFPREYGKLLLADIPPAGLLKT